MRPESLRRLVHALGPADATELIGVLRGDSAMPPLPPPTASADDERARLQALNEASGLYAFEASAACTEHAMELSALVWQREMTTRQLARTAEAVWLQRRYAKHVGYDGGVMDRVLYGVATDSAVLK